VTTHPMALTQTKLVTEPTLPRPFRVTSRVAETEDTFTVELAASDDGPPMSFAPGQFTMVYAHGVGEVPLSISGDPARPEVLTHTIRAVGAVTNTLFELQVGDEIGVRGPYGVGWPMERMLGRDVLIVAGGIGLAPLRPAITQVLDMRDDYRSVSIVYGSRTPDDLLYEDDLHRWKSRFDVNVQVTVDRDAPSWTGDVGVVTPLIGRMSFEPDNAIAVLCGPEIMMRVVAKDLRSRGISPTDIYVSLERNMKCAVGFCGHCQFGPSFVCKDGPVVMYDTVAERLAMGQL
jgi:NAD(P)H-flavin reductase